MYSVSADYLSVMHSPIQTHKFTGKLLASDGTLITTFSGDDFIRDSVTITNQSSDSSEISLGSVYVGEFRGTLKNDLGQTRGTWQGKKLECYFGLFVNNAFETIPLGIYTINEANHSEAGIELVAYDNMQKFDKDLSASQTTGKMYDILSTICTTCGVSLGMTVAQVQALPNGNIQLGMYATNDCKTYRDVISWLAQTAGGFATINRAGELVIRNYPSVEIDTINARNRLTGSKFSDFTTKYTGISVVNMADNTTAYYHLTPDDGLTLNLGSNPFLQYGIDEVVEDMRRAVLNELVNLQYTPFNSSMLGNPAYDLGDVIEYTDGIANGCLCCVMLYEWKLNKTYTVQGFGKNPSTIAAQSKTDKNINGLQSSSQSNELVFFSYANSSAVNVGNTETQISKVKFTNEKETTVETWTEVQLETLLGVGQTSMTVQALYYLDGVLVAYSPIETYTDSAKHLLGLHWFQYVNTVMPHDWTVKLVSNNGTVTIDANNIHTLLKGQGLSTAQAWDGTITVADVVGCGYLDGLTPSTISTMLTLTFQIPKPINFTEVYTVSGLVISHGVTGDDVNVDVRYNDSNIYVGESYAEGNYLADLMI